MQYITWISDGKVSWTLNQAGMLADHAVEIDQRPVPVEPLYIIANLGMSLNFGAVDFEHLTFPAVMRVDYIRVYQPKDAINIGCDRACLLTLCLPTLNPNQPRTTQRKPTLTNTSRRTRTPT
jgi:beta-glucanase (GH16 family)